MVLTTIKYNKHLKCLLSRKTEATQIRIEMKEYSVFIIQKNYYIIIINLFDSIIK